MKVSFTKILFTFLLLTLYACNHHSPRHISRGFYYWKTNVNISRYEQAVMDSVNAHTLYLHFFDVDITNSLGKPKPTAVINFGNFIPQKQVVPVVFITPRALDNMSWDLLDFYAKNIAQLIKNKAASIHLVPKEIQIDCDWSDHNRKRYFSLLKKLNRQPFFKDKTISATIRMYQVKYPKRAGIPPVDKGLLMVYNMGDIRNYYEQNSIITTTTAKKYLQHVATYPLALDVALPIYSWTLLFRKEKLKGILRDVNKKDLQNHQIFKPKGDNRFLVRRDTVFKNYSLYAGEQLRYEASNFNTVHSVANYLSSHLTSDSLRILLYYCDSLNFTQFPSHEMEKIFCDFN